MGPGLKLNEAHEIEIKLGFEHYLTLFSFITVSPDEIVGGLWIHPDPKIEGPCTSLIYFDVPFAEHVSKEKYLVKKWHPLTMGKRITCYHCEVAGHIKEGLWVPYLSESVSTI